MWPESLPNGSGPVDSPTPQNRGGGTCDHVIPIRGVGTWPTARAVDHVSQLTLAEFPPKCNRVMLAHPARGSPPLSVTIANKPCA